MKRVVLCLTLGALLAMLCCAAPTLAAQDANCGNLTEGQIEEYGYEKRAEFIQELKERVSVVKKGLDELSQKDQDSELKEALVKEMEDLADEADKMIEQLNNVDESQWDELKKDLVAVLQKLSALFDKIQAKLSE